MKSTGPKDPLAALRDRGAIDELARKARERINAVHRRPPVLRKGEIIRGESALRGARLSVLIDGHAERHAVADTEAVAADTPLGHAVSVYSLLAPPVIDATVATFLRAPAQALARLDVLAGGEGVPLSAEGARRIQTLKAVITSPAADPVLLPAIVHGEIAAHAIFGERSGVVARAASRIAAVASGLDAAGLAVPEIRHHRHVREYREAVAGFGRADGVVAAVEVFLRGWVDGAEEGASIVAAA